MVLKSAYEIAMEKTGGRAGRRLTEKEKEKLAEIRKRFDAKIAETRILYEGKIRAAERSGDPGSAEVIREEMMREIEKIEDDREKERKKVLGSS
ncbi:MAG: hypothetical protein D6679_03040 [Candidatus Hydrogenedentota bacterium]|nr:MAG: hypothetical protein D6679_03040 [Candidatus Hydrogenedentota bacterium]